MIKQILIVEDEVLVAQYLKRSLERHGYHCAGIAINYEHALFHLQNNSVDAVLLDINIYGEKSGIDLGVVLKEEFSIPFIYLTSYNDPETLGKIKLTSPVAYLQKPVNEASLITNLDLYFSRSVTDTTGYVDLVLGITRYRVDLANLYYIKSDANYVEVHMASEKKLLRTTLKNIIELLPDNMLVKVNRRVALNPRFISEVKGDTIKTTFGQTFKVSPLHRQNLSLK